MKIALPSVGNQVDGHFGHCEFFTIFTLDEQGKIVSREKLDPPVGCGCKSNIVPTLAGMGVKVMLAGNMGGGAVNLLVQHGIEVVRGCSGELEQVVKDWAAGQLRDSGAGCSGHAGCGEHDHDHGDSCHHH